MNNEALSSLTHLIATILSIAGLAVLVSLGAIYGTSVHVVSFSIFGASLILLYLFSTIYHFISKDSKAKKLFQILDHSMIYILIAGTYTPVVLIALPLGWGWTMFGIIWGLAVIGVLKKVFQFTLPLWFSPVFYLLMGWIIVIAYVPLKDAIPIDGLKTLLLGGIFYTVGVIFFALDKAIERKSWYTMHDIFHIFVMLGSLTHFYFMYKFILPL